MSGKFSGFSQEDIHKIRAKSQASAKSNKENGSVPSKAHRSTLPTISQTVANKPKATKSTKSDPPINTPELHLQQASLSETDSSSADNSLRNALHFKPLPVPDYQQTDTVRFELPPNAEELISNNPDVGDSNREEPDRTPATGPLVGVSLREYEARRRMMEEQNRHKKDMIYKAIELRSKKTEADAKQLQNIKDELSKMEINLEKDVRILREKIETASMRYKNSREYYEQIEKAFLKAKLDMQRLLDEKNLLSEHLNIIISNTEQRKGHKLNELVERMGLNFTDLPNDTEKQ